MAWGSEWDWDTCLVHRVPRFVARPNSLHSPFLVQLNPISGSVLLINGPRMDHHHHRQQQPQTQPQPMSSSMSCRRQFVVVGKYIFGRTRNGAGRDRKSNIPQAGYLVNNNNNWRAYKDSAVALAHHHDTDEEEEPRKGKEEDTGNGLSGTIHRIPNTKTADDGRQTTRPWNYICLVSCQGCPVLSSSHSLTFVFLSFNELSLSPS